MQRSLISWFPALGLEHTVTKCHSQIRQLLEAASRKFYSEAMTSPAEEINFDCLEGHADLSWNDCIVLRTPAAGPHVLVTIERFPHFSTFSLLKIVIVNVFANAVGCRRSTVST